MAKPEYNATVIQRIDYNPSLMIIRVAPDGWELPEFEPGQFAVIGLPGSAIRNPLAKPDAKELPPEKYIQRAYSIASSRSLGNFLDFYITMVPEGTLTPRLFNLNAGDKIYLGGKISGHFTMKDVPSEANVIFIGTGTGLAPYIAMLQKYYKANSTRRMAIFHGVRESLDLGYRTDLTLLERVADTFSYHPIISRPQLEKSPWTGITGHVQELWKQKVVDAKWGFHPTPANTHFFLCGSPGMIDSMIELLGQEGFTEHKKDAPGQIHVERYW